ncbi:uncharacterized protein LOC129247875 [Anastrepha obliqua]|uniref:uncharacterized protein LOC129247875 n=1 Tax=Anastrepha obliqua TaxID=95512 RepID=UPI0024096BC2|nr:uncharacterized protein LOC129247875 [Anastrepha obliqua]
MLHLSAMLALLLICCNHIADNLITTFASTQTGKAAAVTTILAPTNEHHGPHTWLRRQRRYLLFEQGSSVGVQLNIAKAILAEMPRGLNEIYEYTYNYELPTTLDMLRPHPRKAHQPKEQSNPGAKSKQITTITTVTTPKMLSSNLVTLNGNDNNSNNHRWLPQWHATPHWPSAEESVAPWWQMPVRRQWFTAQQQQQHKNSLQAVEKQQWFVPTPPMLSRKFAKMPAAAHPGLSTTMAQPSSCTRRNVYGSWRHSWQHSCLASREMLGRGRGRKRSSGGSSDSSGSNENYDGVSAAESKKIDDADHRIDEDVDEFRFAKNAERVFFDLLGKWANIAALPAAHRHATYKTAIWHDNLSDCAQHYATLCGLSFLQHFTEAVHGRFM